MQFSLWLQISLTAIPLNKERERKKRGDLLSPIKAASMFISLNSIRVAGAHLYQSSVVTFSLCVWVYVNPFKQHCYGRHNKKEKGIKAMLLKQAIKGFKTFKRLYRPRNLNEIEKTTAASWIVFVNKKKKLNRNCTFIDKWLTLN